jgi:hypothetical protein
MQIPTEPKTTLQRSDGDLVAIVDSTGLWCNQDGRTANLRGALIRAATVSDRGRSPVPLRGPYSELIDRAQMPRLWKRLGIR